MGIVRFASKFPYTFYVLSAFIVFLGVTAIAVMPEDIFAEIDILVMTVICVIRALMPAGMTPSIISTLTSGMVLYFVGHTLNTMTRARGCNPDERDHSDERSDVGHTIHAAADYQAAVNSLSIRSRTIGRGSRA
jgi:hypothetical protein